MANPLRVNTVELLRRQGTERDLDVTVAFGTLSEHPGIDAEAPVHVRVHLDSLNDGIVVTGTITAPWHGTCRRCAAPAGGELVAQVDERYQEHVTDPDAFELDGDHLDLEPMVRELVLLEVPESPLCRQDCAGLCPTCGIDRNAGSCDCAPPAADDRWSALDQLRASLDATPDQRFT